jgi:ABC-type multidrug transport system fused ATPase/permease subunit
MNMTLALKRYRDLLMTYLRPQWLCVCLLILLLFGEIGLSLINPQIIQVFIDTASSGAATQELFELALVFLGVAILQQAVAPGETYVAENIGLSTTNRLRADLMLHCLRLDPAFYVEHTPGDLIERVDGDVALLGNFFSRFMISMLGNVLLLLGVLVMLFRVDWRVGVVLTLFVSVALAIVVSLRNVAVPYWEAERQASADLFGFLEERLSGTEDIRSSDAATYMLHGLAACSRQLLRKLNRARLVSSASWSSMVVLSAIGTALALALGGYLFQTRQISLGTAYLIFSYAALLNTPIEQIIQQMRDLQQATGSITRILKLFDVHSVLQEGSGETVPAGPLVVEFDAVSFRYVADVPVLKNITFALQPGMVMGLLGRTGSGKSTLMKLLVRLYDPDAGTIRLGGVDLRAMLLGDVRARIGMVTQDVHVLHTTVRNNLTLFDPALADEKIIQALADLGLETWYNSLPNGLDTQLKPGGSGLSAGEAQLLAFARVFLQDLGLIILDEASSRLDPATERLLEHAIDQLLAGRTGIIIAHRLATVQRADTIMILEDGQCCEYGQRETLASDPGTRFAQLLRKGLEEVLS